MSVGGFAIDNRDRITPTEPTIADHLRRASRSLSAIGSDAPRLEAEVLMAHALRLTRAQLLARATRRLTLAEARDFDALLARRLRHEPLAYLVGHREFFGLDFQVDPRVLIPRPETELLAERAIAYARHLTRPATIADIGTGSGAIAISLAVHLPNATVYAIDASPGALAVAAANVAEHHVSDRVQLLAGDLLAPLPRPVDIVVANLPYIPTADLATLQPEVRDFEPVSALDGGPDGLDAYRRLLRQVPGRLVPGGRLMLEIGADQGQAIVDLVHELLPGASINVEKDYAGLDRLATITWHPTQP